MTYDALLSVKDLQVTIGTRRGPLPVLNGVSFQLNRGEVLGIVGESGSGKSVAMLSILGLLPPSGRVVGGQIEFNGHDLASASQDVLRSVRGRQIAMVFQDPATSMNPAFRVGRQIAEPRFVHGITRKRPAPTDGEPLLASVGFPDPARQARSYPHELSGGMQQRAMIAAALSTDPQILIADEPTTALDVTIQAEILSLLRQRISGSSMGTILISHNLGVVADICERVIVLYGGRVLEVGPTADVFARPRHPYTAALLRSTPRLHAEKSDLVPIPGTPPDFRTLPKGCVFNPRCAVREPRCVDNDPPLRTYTPAHEAACWVTAKREGLT